MTALVGFLENFGIASVLLLAAIYRFYISDRFTGNMKNSIALFISCLSFVSIGITYYRHSSLIQFFSEILTLISGIFFLLWLDSRFPIKWAKELLCVAFTLIFIMVMLFLYGAIDIGASPYSEFSPVNWEYRTFFLAYALGLLTLHIMIISIPLRSFFWKIKLRYKIALASFTIFAILSLVFPINIIFASQLSEMIDVHTYSAIQNFVTVVYVISWSSFIFVGTKSSEYRKHIFLI